MAIHFLPLLLAKVASKLALKKAAVHHGAHHSLGKKIVQEGVKKGASTLVQPQSKHEKEPKDGDTR